MNELFLKRLSDADAVAAQEDEVRRLMVSELELYCDRLSFDRLGSAIFEREGDPDGPRVMICAHMDEVGFLVRSISDLGMLYVLPVGSVRTFSKFMQGVRVTASAGRKIPGILDSVYDNGEVKDLIVDIGAVSKEEVLSLGIRVGNMVTFDTEFRAYGPEDTYAGKALDDRYGCFVLAETLKRLAGKALPNRSAFAATSSEEVGLRGGETAAYQIAPDVVIVLDVGCWHSELCRDHTNNRQIGRGPMLLHYDKTMVPSSRFLALIERTASECGVPLQHDMFSNGGTDGGPAHLTRGGAVCAVLGLPLRYGHSPFSICRGKDADDAVRLLTSLLEKLDAGTWRSLVDYRS